MELGLGGPLRKLRSVQVMRGIAVCAVVVFHSTQGAAGFTFTVGNVGVDLFFVISGFIMGTIAPGQKARDFFARRLWRIYPMWWLAALVALLTSPFRYPDRILASLSLWPIWGHGFSLPRPPVGWSLSFELLFYAGMTLALRTRAAVPLVILAVAMTAAWFSDNSFLHFVGSPLIFEFLFGLAISKLPTPRLIGAACAPIGVAMLAFVPAAALVWGDAMGAPTAAAARVLYCGVPCALIFYGLFSLDPWFGSKRWDFAVFLGDASYSIYLFHIFVVRFLGVPWLPLAVCSVSVGAVMYALVEQRIVAFAAARRRSQTAVRAGGVNVVPLG